ncbi:nitrogen regulation protein NR(II) [Geobacter sp. DSM 9736]|uniref:two-component system sensor histidine kinase NtrB n=1 Tax=Geobacter sp. DSM 9736 TaxID=1277350 RepID=UPI000B514A7C|nr:ATP-binding protein [Geobacter sp. DSM 9736]SNB44734.1 Signal transduction histidine kinase [Geobacter sp. DSM 9736]
MKKSPYPRIALLSGCIVGISLLHYLTPLHLPMLHDIFQRLYYIPIILAAFWFGLRGGIISALVVSVFYVPHILFQWGLVPSIELEKFLEIVLYNVVGGITGFLSQKEESRREELQRTAEGLEESYRKLQEQTDMILKIEDQLRRAERLSALGELSAVLAHEIRNPLGSIRGTAEILRDDFRPEDRKYEFLEILIKEADRLNRVVEDFLGLARPVPTERETCDLLADVQEIMDLVAPEAAARGVRLNVVPQQLPSVHGSRERLRQVFLNLVLNAIQATGPGGSLTVAARLLPATGEMPPRVEVSFADTGKGIEPERLERVFQPFFTTKHGGTGLGLPIAQRIIESHGGTIHVESELHRGTTFIVRLPV